MAMGPCSKNKTLVVATYALLCTAPIFAQSEEWQGDERTKEQFLCKWRIRNAPDESRPLDFCTNTQLPIGLSLVQQDGFWGDQAHTTKSQFEKDWLSSAEYATLLNEKKESRARDRKEADRRRAAEKSKLEQQAARRHAEFDTAAAGMPANELCAGLHDGGYESARTELKKRNALTAHEWELIDRGAIAVGMSETALLCSWGRARANRTITASSVRLQYIYESGAYVYVLNGRVTSIQDTQ